MCFGLVKKTNVLDCLKDWGLVNTLHEQNSLQMLLNTEAVDAQMKIILNTVLEFGEEKLTNDDFDTYCKKIPELIQYLP